MSERFSSSKLISLRIDCSVKTRSLVRALPSGSRHREMNGWAQPWRPAKESRLSAFGVCGRGVLSPILGSLGEGSHLPPMISTCRQALTIADQRSLVNQYLARQLPSISGPAQRIRPAAIRRSPPTFLVGFGASSKRYRPATSCAAWPFFSLQPSSSVTAWRSSFWLFSSSRPFSF